MRLALLVAVTAICLAQTPSPPAAISAYYRLAGNSTGPFPYQWLIIDSPLALTYDGVSPHLGCPSCGTQTGLAIQSSGVSIGTASTLDIEPGVGISLASQINSGTLTLQANYDTAIVSYRVDPPKNSGPCINPVDNQTYGTGAWASDGAYFYICVPVPATPPNSAPPSFVWGRSPIQTQW